MAKTPCCDKNTVKKGPWTPEEDEKLVDYIQKHGHTRWRTLPKNAGLKRCGKSCRLRWTNYLRPDIKRGGFSFEEDEAIINLHSILGNKWSTIATCIPGRTDNEIKNHWNTNIRKRLLKMGIDPVTHTPRLDLQLSSIYNNGYMNFNPNSIGTDSQTSATYNSSLLDLAASLLSLDQDKNGHEQVIQSPDSNNQVGNADAQNQFRSLTWSPNVLVAFSSNIGPSATHNLSSPLSLPHQMMAPEIWQTNFEPLSHIDPFELLNYGYNKKVLDQTGPLSTQVFPIRHH